MDFKIIQSILLEIRWHQKKNCYKNKQQQNIELKKQIFFLVLSQNKQKQENKIKNQ